MIFKIKPVSTTGFGVLKIQKCRLKTNLVLNTFQLQQRNKSIPLVKNSI